MPGTEMPTLGVVSGWVSGMEMERREREDIQFPITAVLTRRVMRVSWFAAVLLLRRAVV